jgi:hypothetical protein
LTDRLIMPSADCHQKPIVTVALLAHPTTVNKQQPTSINNSKEHPTTVNKQQQTSINNCKQHDGTKLGTLLNLAPREIQKKDQVLVSNRPTFFLDPQKVVTLGTTRRTMGKDNLFQLFDKYRHGTAAFMTHEIPKFGFIFWGKNGKRLCLTDQGTRKALRNMLDHHKKKNRPIRLDKDLFFHKMKTKQHQLTQSNPDKDNYRSQLDGIEKIAEQFLFPVRKEMLYCVRKLHERPHGLSLSTEREKATKYWEIWEYQIQCTQTD